MKIKHNIQLSLVAILLNSPMPLLAGDIEPTTAPESTNSYIIGDICDRLDTGAAVAKTGQTTSYATGDDGDLEKGSTWANPRFTDNGSTVTDNLTGLIWLKNANCNNGTMNLTDALNFANTLFDGSNNHNGGDCSLTDSSKIGDWRLPNWNELWSLIDAEYYNPALSNAAGTAKWTENNAFLGVQRAVGWVELRSTHPTFAIRTPNLSLVKDRKKWH